MFFFTRRRREKLKQQPFPPEWVEIIKRNVPAYNALSPDDRRELQGHIQIFLYEKTFEGMGGLEITDDIRLSIAAQACMLLLHRKTNYYPTLNSILVYPHSYVVKVTRRLPGGIVEERLQTRLGESWHRGEVVLSWDDVRQGAADAHDGHNVVYHEFAHQLDGESGDTEGAPVLPRRSMYIPWARVLGEEYQQLLDDLEHHRQTFINSYGATNPAEFFAVITEAFFEQPRGLQKHHPELYDQLKQFYMQDPLNATGGKD